MHRHLRSRSTLLAAVVCVCPGLAPTAGAAQLRAALPATAEPTAPAEIDRALHDSYERAVAAARELYHAPASGLAGPGVSARLRQLNLQASPGQVIGISNLPPGVFGLRWYLVTISTSTPNPETFLVFQPTPTPVQATPMVVAFHGFGVSALDIPVNTSFIYQCFSRGWYLMAPLGGVDVHFSSPNSKTNTIAALDWMTARFPIDPDRVYGIGFSMGGGACMNFAATQLDPTKTVLAAAVNNTGGVALRHNLFAAPNGHMFIFDNIFGDGTPGSADVWEMQRASVIDFNPTTLTVDTTADLARNLGHIPIRNAKADNDPVAFLTLETDVFDTYLLAAGKQLGVDYEYVVKPSAMHSWSTLDAAATFDWLDQFTLQKPSNGELLADRDARYFNMEVVQDTPSVFTPISWAVNVGSNGFSVQNTENLTSVELFTLDAGLDPTQPLTVFMDTSDNLFDTVIIRDVPVIPTTVNRDLNAAPGSQWSYVGTSVIITEVDGGPHTWTLIP